MAKQNPMERLHLAALQLINDIDESILNDAPEGIFRLPASASTINDAIEKIQMGQNKSLEFLDQYGRSSLLKAILRKMKDEGAAIFSNKQFQALVSARKKLELDSTSEDPEVAKGAKENYQKTLCAILKGAPYMRQKIAYNFLNMLNKVATKQELTKMGASNLAAMTGAILFALPRGSDESVIHEANHYTEQLIESAAKLSKPEKILGSTHFKNLVNGSDKNQSKNDQLIHKILLDFKKELEKAHSEEHLNSIVGVLEKSPEYQDLKVGQGLMAKIFGLQMPSIKAFEEMVGEQKNNFMIEKDYRDLNAI